MNEVRARIAALPPEAQRDAEQVLDRIQVALYEQMVEREGVDSEVAGAFTGFWREPRDKPLGNGRAVHLYPLAYGRGRIGVGRDDGTGVAYSFDAQWVW